MVYFKPGELFELSLGWRSAEKITLLLHEIFSIILQLIVIAESVCYNHQPRVKVFLKIKLFPSSIISLDNVLAYPGCSERISLLVLQIFIQVEECVEENVRQFAILQVT